MLLLSRIIKYQGVPVLLYHRIIEEPLSSPVYAVSLTGFKKQMEYLCRAGYNTISCLELVEYVNGEISLPDKSFVITFDDGFRDNYEAIKIANKYGFKSVLFIATEFIGCEYDYLPFIGEYSRDNFNKDKALRGKVSFLTVEQLKELKELGTEIFPHTANHRNLISADYDQQKKEVKDSQDRIHDVLGIDPELFCYPYGDYNEDTIKVLNCLNYYGAFAVRDGLNRNGDNPFTLKRHDVTDFSMPYFKLLLTQQFAWYHKIGQIGRTLKGKYNKGD